MDILKDIWEQLKRFWAGWTRIARIIGNFQARVLLTIMYATLVLPFGVLVRLLADPMRVKHRPTSWLETQDQARDMEWARRQ